MLDKTIFEMAERLKALKDRKKDLESEVKAVGAEIDEMDAALSDAMAEAEVERFAHQGSTFYLNSRLFASPAAGQKEAMIEALKANGYGSLVTESVNANTLASFVKEQREQTGAKLPEWLDGIVTTFEKVTVGVRKG